MRNLYSITYFLVILGALNWGLVGFFKFDLLALLFGDMTAFTRILYALVGLSAIVQIVIHSQVYKPEKSFVH